jgi:hypothetical protein
MGWSERHAHFERLVALHMSYPAHPDDQTGVLSVEDAIIYAEAVMAAASLEIEPWLIELDRVLTEEDDAVGDTSLDSPRIVPDGGPAGSNPRPRRPGQAARRRLLGDFDRD